MFPSTLHPYRARPYLVFSSTVHMWKSLYQAPGMQKTKHINLVEYVFSNSNDLCSLEEGKKLIRRASPRAALRRTGARTRSTNATALRTPATRRLRETAASSSEYLNKTAGYERTSTRKTPNGNPRLPSAGAKSSAAMATSASEPQVVATSFFVGLSTSAGPRDGSPPPSAPDQPPVDDTFQKYFSA